MTWVLKNTLEDNISAKLILSFDCEGKWGMLDREASIFDQRLSRKYLISCYRLIFDILMEYQVKGVFAFVGAFTSKREYAIKWLEHLYKNSRAHRDWLRPVFEEKCKDHFMDHFMPELIEMTKSNNHQHEIATHGFTHLTWDLMDAVSCKLELESILDWTKVNGLNCSTIIFPRNIVNHLDLLKDAGFLGYRGPPNIFFGNRKLNKLYSLSREFTPFFAQSDMARKSCGLIEIPGDFFLNWRSGLRRLVPPSVTLNRLSWALRHAKKSNGIVHLWFHPHNLITGNNQIQLFRKAISKIVKMRDKGQLEIITQHQLCIENA